MSLENAQQFVAIMKQEADFRQAACQAAVDQKLETFFQGRGYQFDMHHLVMAMAECMDEMDQCCPNHTKA